MVTISHNNTRAKEILTYLAAGLIRQDEEIAHDKISTIVQINPLLQKGWDMLALFCFQNQDKPPSDIQELIRWLEQPIESWGNQIGQLFEAASFSGKLLNQGIPTELCNELIEGYNDHPDLGVELEDDPFKQILKYCSNEECPLPELYTAVRRFLVEHPFLPEGAIQLTKPLTTNPQWSEVLPWLQQCYEKLPMLCWHEKGVALCSRCGWPLIWRQKDYPSCYSDFCRQFQTGKLDFHPTLPGALRTKMGIQRSIVGPEKPLLQLYQRLIRQFQLEVELWPKVDTYDLLIHWPDGQKWVVDMKDWDNPRLLAEKVHLFKKEVDWEYAFFVFPNYRKYPGYLHTFKVYWRNSQPNCDALFEDEFIKKVRERMANYA